MRGGLLLLGLLLVLGSGGLFWYILRGFDEREEYLIAARTIERREIARPGDFAVVEANIGSAQGIPPEFIDLILDRWAAGRIPAGTIVTPGMFQAPPLSNDDESGKVLIEVSLPSGDAPGGSLKSGERVALFGAEGVDGEPGGTAVALIGVLELDFVEGDNISYVVTPAEAREIQSLVDRYNGSSDRRMWKLGFDLASDDLVGFFGASSPPAAPEDLFAGLPEVSGNGGGAP